MPGALEIPQVLSAAAAARAAGRTSFDGAIALGCVIRGETAHYDIVVNNANHWLMETAITKDVPVGNGILTVDTEAQAMARAEGGIKGKGGDAARACLALIETKRGFWGQTRHERRSGRAKAMSSRRERRRGSRPCRRSTRWTWPEPTSTTSSRNS